MSWNDWFANALRSETPKHGPGNDRLTPGLAYGSGDAENRIEVGHKQAATEADRRAFGGAQKVEKPIMSRLAMAFVLALASVAANAQASGNGIRPFLFDGRMPGDGARGRQGALADDRHPNAGAIVVPPKESQPERGR